MSKSKLLLGAGLVVIIIGGIVLLSGTSSSVPASQTANMDSSIPSQDNTPVTADQSVPQDRAATTTVPVSSNTPTGSVKEFTITAKDFSFAPSVVKVNKGDTVKITFKNAEGFHDLKIDEFNVATKRVKAGAEDSVQFVADKTGTFQYYCSVGNHRAMGMWGTLTVE